MALNARITTKESADVGKVVLFQITHTFESDSKGVVK